MFRNGIGFAVYPFTENRKFVLGGVFVDHEEGLQGNFDGDALSHAICEALLGAASLGDLQSMFPLDDTKYKDISGLRLLELVKIKLARSSMQIENIDAIIVCPSLDLSSLKTNMAINIARTLEIYKDYVSIKISNSVYPLKAHNFRGVAVLATCAMLDITEGEGEIEEESSE